MSTTKPFAYGDAADFAKKSLASKYTRPAPTGTDIYLPQAAPIQKKETTTWYFQFAVHHHGPGNSHLGMVRGTIEVNCELATGVVVVTTTERP